MMLASVAAKDSRMFDRVSRRGLIPMAFDQQPR